jgi:hypothetical protein
MKYQTALNHFSLQLILGEETVSRINQIRLQCSRALAFVTFSFVVLTLVCPALGGIVVAPGFQMELVNANLPGLQTDHRSMTPGVAVVPAGYGTYEGDIFVANRGSSSNLFDGEILRVDPDLGTRSLFAEVNGNPSFLTFGPGGSFGTNLFVSSNQNPSSTTSGMVSSVTNTGTVSLLGNPDPDSGSDYLFGGVDLAISTGGAFGEYLYAGTSGGFISDSVTRMTSAGGRASPFYDFGGILSGSPRGLAFGTGQGGFDQNLYVGLTTLNTSPAEAGVYVLDSLGTRLSLATASNPSSNGLITSIAEIGFSPGGPFGTDLYAGDLSGSILRIDSSGNTSALVSGMDYAFGLAFADSDTLYLTGIDPDSGQLNLYRVTSVPEPSTYALAAMGLLGLGFIGWKRRKGF